MKLDDVLTAVKDVDNLCDFSRCKAKTSLMGQDCEYCSKRFCFKHGLPEGNLAKLSFIGGIGKSVIFERLFVLGIKKDQSTLKNYRDLILYLFLRI